MPDGQQVTWDDQPKPAAVQWDTAAAPKAPAATDASKVPNARIRNLPNPAEGMSPLRAAYEGAKTGLSVASLPAMAASPVGAAKAIPVGMVGSAIGSTAAQASGAGEFGQEVAGDLTGLAFGAAADPAINLTRGAVRATVIDPVTGKATLTPHSIAERFLRTPEEAQTIRDQKELGGIRRSAALAKARAPLDATPQNVEFAGEEEKIGKPGTVAQETGYQPPVTRVPIRPEPSYKVTPESIPGPDTAGKGNLLTPLAKRGDPRMAMELTRRGRPVLFTGDEGEPGRRLEGTFEERLQGSPTPFSNARMETDSLGIRWAVSPEGYRVSIPRSVPDEQAMSYAGPKLAEQQEIHQGMIQ